MINNSSNTRALCLCIALQILISATAGCGRFARHLHNGAHCFPFRREAPQDIIATVNVGGQVHEPGRVEIGSGLTLHRALMSAGGARELAVSDARTTSDPELATKLNKIASIGRLIGKYNYYEIAWDDYMDQAKNIIPITRQQAIDARIEQESIVGRLITELSRSLSNTSLTRLLTYSAQAGRWEEQLRLYNSLPPQGPLAKVEEQARKTSEHEAEALKFLLEMRVGGTSFRSIRSEFFVGLSRPYADPPVTYYFPYDLVISGQPGEIALQDGDTVDVVDVRDTELNPQSGVSGGEVSNVAIDGYVQNPGVLSAVTTIGGVHAQSSPTINDPRSVWMLVRPGPSGVGERVFVLPDRLVQANGAASDAPTLNGDVYTYVILPQVPIVLETLLLRTLDASRRRCLDKLHDKKALVKERVARNRENRVMARTME